MKPTLFVFNAFCLGLACLLPSGLKAASFTQETDAEFLANGDFDGDGLLDLLIVDRQSGAVRVLKGAADGKLIPLGAMASGITTPAFASVGRLGDGTAAAPSNDRLLIGSPTANRAVIVNPRFPAATPRPMHLLGIAPEAAAVVPLPSSVVGNTAHDDIIGRARDELSVLDSDGHPTDKPGAIREVLNKGSSFTPISRSHYTYNLRSLNAVAVTKDSAARTLVVGLASFPSPSPQGGGDTTLDNLVMLNPGNLLADATSGMLTSGSADTFTGMANARYVASIFGSDTMATIVVYRPGSADIKRCRVVIGSPPSAPAFGFGPIVTETLSRPVAAMCVIQNKAGQSQIAVSYDDGSAEILGFGAQGLETLAALNMDPELGAIAALAAGPAGAVHVLHTDDGSGRSSLINTLVDDGDGNWSPLSTEPVRVPLHPKTLNLANVLVFDKPPFANSEIRLLGAYRAGDWTQRVTFSGRGSTLTASAISETFRDPELGLGAAGAVNLGSVAGPTSGIPGQLVNQYADNVSIFSLEQAQGELVDVVKADPPPGLYDGIIHVTLRAAGGSPIYVRRNGYESFQLYDSPLLLAQDTQLEYYAEAAGGRRGAIARSDYQFSAEVGKLDSDRDGVPDFVEMAKGLSPTQGADSDADGASDLAELLAGTDPKDRSSQPPADSIFPGNSRFYAAVRPLADVDGNEIIAAAGEAISAYAPSGQLLGSGHVIQTEDGTQAMFPLSLPVQAPTVVAFGTPSNIDMQTFTLSDGGTLPVLGPIQSYPELVGMQPLPRLTELKPDFELTSLPSDSQSMKSEVDRWLAACQSAWQQQLEALTLAVNLSVRDTVALLVLEAKVTQVMRSRGMLGDGSNGSTAQFANLTPWRTRRDPSLITPSASQWRQLEQAGAQGDSLRPREILQQIYSMIDTMENAPEAEPLRLLVGGVYAAAAQREFLEAMLQKPEDPTFRSAGSIGSPVDVLRYLINQGTLPPADGPSLWGIAALAAVDEHIAAVVDAVPQATSVLNELLGSLDLRSRSTLILEVPDLTVRSELEGLGGLILIDSDSPTEIYRLLDAKGNDYEATKGLRLPVGARFEVVAFTDLPQPSALGEVQFSDLEVISMRWVRGSVPDINVGAQPPLITFLEAISGATGESMDITRPLFIAEESSVTLNVNVEGDAEGLSLQWRRNGVPILDAINSSLQLDATADNPSFAGFYDVLVTNVAGRTSSFVIETRVLRIKPIIEALEAEIVGTSVPGRNVLAGVGEAVTLRVRAQSAASDGMLYQWLHNGVAIANANEDTLLIDAITPAQFGTYTVRVSPNDSKATAAQKTLSDAFEVAVVSHTSTDIVRNFNQAVTLPAIAAGKNLKFFWSKKPGALDSRAIVTTKGHLTISNLGFTDIGLYQCIVEMGDDVRRLISSHNLNVLVPPRFAAVEMAMPDVVVGGFVGWKIPITGTYTSISATGLPSGLLLDAQEGLIRGTARVAAGTYNISLKASNAYGSSSATAVLVVRPLNIDLVGDYVAYVPRHPSNRELGASLALTVTTLGTCSGRLVQGTLTHSFSGSLNTADGSNAILVVDVISSLKLAVGKLVIELDAENAALRGTLMPPAGTVATLQHFEGWSNYWSRSRAPINNPYVGRQHWLMRIVDEGANEESVKLPGGYGYAAAVILTNGNFTATGRAGDGESLTFNGFIGKQGQLGLMQLLYGTTTKGSLHGKINLAASSSAPINGNLTWSRPRNPLVTARLYRDGFATVGLLAEGGKYSAPAAGSRILNLGSQASVRRVRVNLSNRDAGIEQVGAVSFALNTANTFSAPAYSSIDFSNGSATVTTTTGMVRGSLTRSDTNPLNVRNKLTRALSLEGLIVPLDGVPAVFGSFMASSLPTTPLQTLNNTNQYQGSVVFEPIPSPP